MESLDLNGMALNLKKDSSGLTILQYYKLGISLSSNSLTSSPLR